ncbi:MAG TPA: hypothetical protein VGN18_18875 [Jatrophihabitans sp.]|uniref:hypothetical protein n=1 Tax=Jatrophihabitans sp. TaxID=1932789 RepID=UPI002E0CC0DF|nr:hypothetical protein [Jatrophihabitans sp.]
MSKVTIALLALAAVVSLGHWLSMLAATHVDMHLLPTHSRRHVQWMLVNSWSIQLGCAAVALAAVAGELASSL